MSWPLGTATPPEECGVCHSAIYREYAFGFGSDLQYKGIVYKSPQEKLLKLPSNISSTGTAHFLAGLDPFPIHARGIEEEGRSCDVCHFPQAFEIPDMGLLNVSKRVSRPKTQELGGLTCASCHLTPDGKNRGPYDVEAPHLTVQDTRMQTSAMCAYCHSMVARVAGKLTQTFLSGVRTSTNLDWADSSVRTATCSGHFANLRNFTEDQTEIYHTSLSVKVE